MRKHDIGHLGNPFALNPTVLLFRLTQQRHRYSRFVFSGGRAESDTWLANSCAAEKRSERSIDSRPF